MLIASKSVIIESKWGIELLVNNPILLPLKLFWQPIGEPRPQRRSRKKLRIENKAEYKVFVKVEALNDISIRTEGLQNRLAQRSKTNLGGIIGKNSSNRLVRLMHIKFAKLVIETSSKVREFNTYNKAISNPIYGNK